VSDPVLVKKEKIRLIRKYGYFQPTVEDVELGRWDDPDRDYHVWEIDSVTGNPTAYGHNFDDFVMNLKSDQEMGRAIPLVLSLLRMT
jgi:hypothetical protein